MDASLIITGLFAAVKRFCTIVSIYDVKLWRFRARWPRSNRDFKRRGMKKPGKIAPAKGKLGVLLPGMGAVSTTFMAGVELVRKGESNPGVPG